MFDLDSQETETAPPTFEDEFISEYIQTQKARIKTRELIQEMLFFSACQVASASLALMLFQFAVQVLFTTWLCLFVAWIPSLNNLSEVHFQKTEDGWNLKIMNRPIITLIKFVSSVGIVTVTIYGISREITDTANQILAVYSEIDQYESPQIQNYFPPYLPQVILASVGIVALISGLRWLNNRNPF